ncbi:MAG: HipA N-terminal domain-containing protein [Bacteroidota bacterium]
MIKKTVKELKEKLVNTLNEFVKSSAPANNETEFSLTYEDLPIGYLKVKDGLWIFEYTSYFKYQEELKPIIDFPDKSKRYESEILWPFFASRIPSLSRPSIKEAIEKSETDSTDIIELLKQFGKKTIANPYDLNAA